MPTQAAQMQGSRHWNLNTELEKHVMKTDRSFWSPKCNRAPGHCCRLKLCAEQNEATVFFFLHVGPSIVITAFRGYLGWNAKPQKPSTGKIWTIPSTSPFPRPPRLPAQTGIWRTDLESQESRGSQESPANADSANFNFFGCKPFSTSK